MTKAKTDGGFDCGHLHCLLSDQFQEDLQNFTFALMAGIKDLDRKTEALI